MEIIYSSLPFNNNYREVREPPGEKESEVEIVKSRYAHR